MNPVKPYWPVAVLAVTVLGAAALAAAAPAGEPPAPPPPPGAVRPEHNADLDAQLEAARRKLEQAANEVARLSAQLSTTAIDEFLPSLAPGHAIIGVQLEPARDTAGARVREVSPGGPAAEAGIRTGDVVIAVNGTTVSGAEPTRQVVGIMHDVKPDSRVSVRVLRDGKPREFTLTARAGPNRVWFDPGFADLPELKGVFMFHRPLGDMELATLTPQLGSYFGSSKGVLVVRAPADGALKLEDGDVILAIDGREPTSGSHATRILGSYQPGETIRLRIVRQHKTMEVDAQLPDKGPAQHKDMMHRGSLPEAPEVQPRKVVVFGMGQA